MLWGAVLLGGALGSAARYGVGLWMLHHLAPTFPWATLTVNVIGSFVIGAVIVLADEQGSVGPALRTFLVVGVLGGFTTFSSFSVETMRLWETRPLWVSLANVAASLGLCLGSVAVGAALVRRLAT